MILSKENLRYITAAGIEKPTESCFALPEKVLQFGTGVLLRGLPDYFIDKANRNGIFNGRIVVVKSTGNGDTDEFAAQDGLFTHYIKGIEKGILKEEVVINCSISRVLAAANQWKEILACAENEAMQVVISNTTEVGLTLLAGENINDAPPGSFPGKLTAFLYARYKFFHGSAESGMVIIPTELIPNNGNVLRNICVQIATANGLEESFLHWLTTANDFCNSLVDSIVPGAPPAQEAVELTRSRGYDDKLHITSEQFRLWAIETKRSRTRDILSFSSADEGVVLKDNIQKFREMKLYLLNGAHTFTCGLAVISEFASVKEAMANSFFEDFIIALMLDEIAPMLVGNNITKEEAGAFALKVLDRFRNPFIGHQWLSICSQYTSKMNMRCVPVLMEYYGCRRQVPQHMAVGFGAYILFMRSFRNNNGQYIGRAGAQTYTIQDEKASILHKHWQNTNTETVVHAILSDEKLWGIDLSRFAGFEMAVIHSVRKFLEQNAGTMMQQAEIMAD